MYRKTNEFFLLGLLSIMDAWLNVRMVDALAEIPVDDEVKKALLGRPSRYRPVFEVVLNYESGTWEQLTHSAAYSGLPEEFLPICICVLSVG